MKSKIEQGDAVIPKQYKMTTDIPAGIITPDRVETRLGHVELLRRLPGRGDRADGLRQPRLSARRAGFSHLLAGGRAPRGPHGHSDLWPGQSDRAHQRIAAGLAPSVFWGGEHRERLHRRLARHERRPIGHRDTAARTRHDQRLLGSLRRRPGHSRPRSRSGRKVPAHPTGLHGRRARRLLRPDLPHLRERVLHSWLHRGR